MIDVIVVSYNSADLLRACLASLPAEAGGHAVRAVVVDNASADGSAAMVRETFPGARLIALDENVGFGAANNRGLAASDGELVLFLNPDAELRAGALDALAACVESDPACAVAGPRLVYPDGRFQPSCRRLPTPPRALWSLAGMEARLPGVKHLRNWLTEEEHTAGGEVDMVSGACFLARRSYLEARGGFEENLFLYEEESDLMIPARRAGMRVRHCPEAVVVHHAGGASADAGAFCARQLLRSKYVLFRKHYGPRAARRAYRYDQAVLGLSAAWNRLRGRASDAAWRRGLSRRAWRESFVPVAELRRDPSFFA